MDRGFVDRLGNVIRRVASDKPAHRIPSVQECRFCDISAVDCPERVESERSPEERTTEDF